MTQKELKELYIDTVVNESWNGEESWRKFFKDTVGYVVELENGCLVALDKPSIQKDFCFGYSLSSYDSESYDNANAAAADAMTNEKHFMEENLKQVDSRIDAIGDPHRTVYHGLRHSSGPKDSKIHDFRAYRWAEIDDGEVPKGYVQCTDAERAAILDGYKELRKAFEKRLKAYLKRYGLSKVHSWSYWQDE